MRSFTDEQGRTWVASVREEQTPRHHQRWYLVFELDGNVLPMPEVRWQTRDTAERTIRTMSQFELRRRAHIVLERALREHGASPVTGSSATDARERTSVNAG